MEEIKISRVGRFFFGFCICFMVRRCQSLTGLLREVSKRMPFFIFRISDSRHCQP